jgi:endonuclease III related protein
MNRKIKLTEIYQCLLKHFGPQHWWPGEEPFEVIVGAILTQSTSWVNVEKGILNMKKEGVLSPPALRSLPLEKLAGLIYSCGYYNAKTIKLKVFVKWFGERFGDSLERMFATDTFQLRKELLGIHGIGEETADSILLYAGNKPIFVIDAYTRRAIGRLGLNHLFLKYSDYQRLFMENLPLDVEMFNEYHALFVALGKNYCLKSNPSCEACCLNKICQFASINNLTLRN